jgi:hypothetical protein
VAGSGFEDIVFQSGVCTSGSLQGVLAGSHYNRGWTVHNAFSEALERLLLQRFMYEKSATIPDSFYELIDLDTVKLQSLANDASIAFTVEYERYRSSVRQGSAGKTAQFWMIYLDLMQAQCVAHVGVQENNVDMMINAWLKLLPMYFALNKINYAQYGSYYVYTLINMEHLYKEGLSVQAQDLYPLRTSIDQRGEQTINRDAKTSGKLFDITSECINSCSYCYHKGHKGDKV